MELHSIRGGTREALNSKRYTIAVAISLGNKWFTTDNIVGLIRWSLLHTHGQVIVYAADTIHAINIEVRNRKSKENALLLAHQVGQKVLQDVKNVVEETFSGEDRQRIIYATWDDLATAEYKKKVAYLYNLYKTNRKFKSCITSVVKNGTSREEKNFNQKEIDLLGTYILEELPELIARSPIKGVVYDANVYPFDGEITKLSEDIQRGLIFPEIKKYLLDTESKVFLEVR